MRAALLVLPTMAIVGDDGDQVCIEGVKGSQDMQGNSHPHTISCPQIAASTAVMDTHLPQITPVSARDVLTRRPPEVGLGSGAAHMYVLAYSGSTMVRTQVGAHQAVFP